MLGWGVLVGVGVTVFFMIFGAAIPDAVNYCVNGPAVGLAWLWHELGLPPQSEAAFAMPLVFGFLQWFVIGALLGLWRCRRRRKEAEPGASPNGGPATPVGNSGVTEGPPSVSSCVSPISIYEHLHSSSSASRNTKPHSRPAARCHAQIF
jgi:hypothetical protein